MDTSGNVEASNFFSSIDFSSSSNSSIHITHTSFASMFERKSVCCIDISIRRCRCSCENKKLSGLFSLIFKLAIFLTNFVVRFICYVSIYEYFDIEIKFFSNSSFLTCFFFFFGVGGFMFFILHTNQLVE